jgi:hypothetical protein
MTLNLLNLYFKFRLNRCVFRPKPLTLRYWSTFLFVGIKLLEQLEEVFEYYHLQIQLPTYLSKVSRSTRIKDKMILNLLNLCLRYRINRCVFCRKPLTLRYWYPFFVCWDNITWATDRGFWILPFANSIAYLSMQSK